LQNNLSLTKEVCDRGNKSGIVYNRGKKNFCQEHDRIYEEEVTRYSNTLKA